MADFPGWICRRWRFATGPTPTIFTAILRIWMPRVSRDVQKFFRTYYVPNNAVLLLLGDVNPQEGFGAGRKIFWADSRWSRATVSRIPTEPRAERRAPRPRGREIRNAAGDGHRLRDAAAAHAGVVRDGAAGPGAARRAAPGASIANWCWKSRSPWKRTAASTTSSATTGRRK